MNKNTIRDEIIAYFEAIKTGLNCVKNYWKDLVFSFYASLSPGAKIGFTLFNLFLSLYLSAVICGTTHPSTYPKLTFFSMGMIFVFAFVFSFNLIILFCSKSGVFNISRQNPSPAQGKIQFGTFAFFAIACFLLLFLVLLANFPGGTAPDTEHQWKQVQTFIFDDWHPAIHTLFIWVVTKLVNHVAFVVFIQIAIFSFGVGYLAATMERRGFSKRLVLFSAAFIILNPFTLNLMMYPLKDLAFTILVTYSATWLINIYLSRGAWLKKYGNLILFAVVLGIASKIRHNGIFFTIPLLLLIPICYSRQTKKALLVPILAVVVILGIRGPLYTALGVKFVPNTVGESVGIPMTIMADVLVKNPERLTAETKAFLNRIAGDEEWLRKYSRGEYNSIKYVLNAPRVVDTVPANEIMKMTVDTIRNDPRNSLEAIREVTSSVWGLDGRVDMIEIPEPLDSQRHIISRLLNYAFKSYSSAIVAIAPLIYAFTKTGWQMLALLLIGILSFYRNGVAALLFVVPAVAYNLGTMLFLAGTDIRYFHFNAVIVVPFILVLLARKEAKT